MNKPLLRHVSAAIPMLVCRDPASEIAFCRAAFGAVEGSRRTAPDGLILHATLSVGEALFMIHAEVSTLASRGPAGDASSPVVICLYLEEVDRVMTQAVAAGARTLLPVQLFPWGERGGRIVDPAGHVWNLATRAESGEPRP